MSFDRWLFDAINSLAGRHHWLDVLGRGVAVYGLLVILWLVLAVLWWPRDTVERRRYLWTLLTSALLCAVLLLAEWVLTTFILHQDLRARPSNARWATLLITERSHLAFPAWPVVFAFALSIPTLRLAKRPGAVILFLGTLLACSLIYVGVNYPFDVLTGIFLGSAIGATASAAWLAHGLNWRRIAYIWLPLVLWGGIILATVKPTHGESESPVAETAVSTANVTPPANVIMALTPALRPGKVTVEAATNGHLLVAAVKVLLPSPDVTLPQVDMLAHTAVNTTFTGWKALNLLTIEVSADFARGTHPQPQMGTLYTATIDRAQWPAAGFSRADPLPGRKFYHAKFIAPAPAYSPHSRPVSTGMP